MIAGTQCELSLDHDGDHQYETREPADTDLLEPTIANIRDLGARIRADQRRIVELEAQLIRCLETMTKGVELLGIEPKLVPIIAATMRVVFG